MAFSPNRFDLLVKDTLDHVHALIVDKGGEYSGDVDRLANFRKQGIACELPMELIWRVYATKHWDAIVQYTKDVTDTVDRKRMEPLDGRVDDLIVYLLLFKAMLVERNSPAAGALTG